MVASTARNDEVPVSFLSDKPEQELNFIRSSVDSFVVHHATNHRPVVLVSSGGTACDLEVHSVRFLDNFSTGLRGAVCVEEFLKRGYAVVHLWRAGSASPFARVLSQALGIFPANHALDVDAIGRLFATDSDQEEEYVKAVLQQDPYLSDPPTKVAATGTYPLSARDEILLHRNILHSSQIHKALHERTVAMEERRLLTIPFRTIEEYLSRLEIISISLNDCRSLVLFFLAAAVSDFYIPRAERPEHKIQSNEEGLTLQLKPVPKAIGILRRHWAPEAFVASFKLETDKDVLRSKAERAVGRYGCHLVIGNLLQSRHDKVWILQSSNQREACPSDASQWPMTEISRAMSDDVDALESKLVDAVVQAHFEYISYHFHAEGSGVKAAREAQARLEEKKRRIHQEELWRSVKGMCMEVAGVALALLLSYSINVSLQRRLRG